VRTKSLSPPRKQTVFRRLEASAGTEDIVSSLAASDPRASRLCNMMLDPAYAGMSFAQLCSRVGLSAADVMRLYCQRQVAIGMMRAADYLPDIMKSVAMAACGQSGVCGKCAGKGTVSGSTCRACRGSRVPHHGRPPCGRAHVRNLRAYWQES